MEHETREAKAQETHPPKRHRRFEAFSRKYYKWIIAIGGLMVSASLTVRDKQQDKLREFVNSVDTAENFYRLEVETRSETYSINQHLTALESRVALQQLNKGEVSKDALNLEEEKVFTDIEKVMNSVEDDKHLSELISEQNEIRPQLVRIDLQANEVYKRLIGSEYKNGTNGNPDRAETEKSEELAQRLQLAESDLRESIHQFLDRKKNLYERRMIFAGWISYILIAFGLMVSFAGHRAGKDGELPDFRL